MNQTATTRDLEKELKAAKLIREQICGMVGDDPELLRHSIEGQTSLFEILSVMAQADGEDEALAEGISVYIKRLQERKKRIEDRIEIRRTLMANALDVAELARLQTASGTLTRKALPPKAVILEEADIPARFFVLQDPKFDRAALLRALKERAAAIADIRAEPGSPEYKDQLATIDVKHPAIPGATLSNGGATIQIRR